MDPAQRGIEHICILGILMVCKEKSTVSDNIEEFVEHMFS